MRPVKTNYCERERLPWFFIYHGSMYRATNSHRVVAKRPVGLSHPNNMRAYIERSHGAVKEIPVARESKLV